MTLTEWRSTPATIKAGQQITKDKTFIAMMEVVSSELPTNRSLPVMGASGEDFAYAYGVEVGYRNCQAVMALMAKPIEVKNEVTPDFSVDNNNDNEEK